MEDIGGVREAVGGEFDGTGGAMCTLQCHQDSLGVTDYHQLSVDQACKYQFSVVVGYPHLGLAGWQIGEGGIGRSVEMG